MGFQSGNAGAGYTEFSRDLSQFGESDCNAIGATDFRDPVRKEHKPAGFLVGRPFPWKLVDRIGVMESRTRLWRR